MKNALVPIKGSLAALRALAFALRAMRSPLDAQVARPQRPGATAAALARQAGFAGHDRRRVAQRWPKTPGAGRELGTVGPCRLRVPVTLVK